MLLRPRFFLSIGQTKFQMGKKIKVIWHKLILTSFFLQFTWDRMRQCRKKIRDGQYFTIIFSHFTQHKFQNKNRLRLGMHVAHYIIISYSGILISESRVLNIIFCMNRHEKQRMPNSKNRGVNRFYFWILLFRNNRQIRFVYLEIEISKIRNSIKCIHSYVIYPAVILRF